MQGICFVDNQIQCVTKKLQIIRKVSIDHQSLYNISVVSSKMSCNDVHVHVDETKMSIYYLTH